LKTTNYSKIAVKYDNNQFRSDEIKFDHDLNKYIEDNGKSKYTVLDLSCGTGLYLEKQMNYFADININWHGLDLSEQMLQKANKKVNKAEFTNANVEEMPYHSEAFDFIANNYAFHHYCNKEQALNEIYRVLKKGGIYKLHNIAIHDMPNWWVYHYFPSAHFEDLKRFWNKDILFNELTTRGLEINLKIEYRKENIRLSDYLDFAENRDISVLTLINDKEYEEGLERMKYDMKMNPDKTIANDFAEMFCIAKKLY